VKLSVNGVARNSLDESKGVQNVQKFDTCDENMDIPGLAATLKEEGS
jgi:hypothetical protein